MNKIRFVTYIDPEKQIRFKSACALASKSMSEAVEELIDKFTAKSAKKERETQ